MQSHLAKKFIQILGDLLEWRPKRDNDTMLSLLMITYDRPMLTSLQTSWMSLKHTKILTPWSKCSLTQVSKLFIQIEEKSIL